MKIRLLALTVLAAALLAVPASASADDASLYQAWSAEDARGQAIGERLDRTGRRWERTKLREWKPFYRAIRDFAKYTADTRAKVAAQSASSPKGNEVRTAALEGLRLMKASYDGLARGVRLAAKRKPRAALRAIRRARRLEKRGMPLIRQADRGFRELGFGT